MFIDQFDVPKTILVGGRVPVIRYPSKLTYWYALTDAFEYSSLNHQDIHNGLAVKLCKQIFRGIV